MIDLYVTSSIYDTESEAIEIDDYYLTRITEEAFDIHILFRKPDKITEIITEPDKLGIRFKKTEKYP